MICLITEYWARPALDLPARHRTWWIRWTYGDQTGLVLAETCSCTAGPCRGLITSEELRDQVHAAVETGVHRQHEKNRRDDSAAAG